MDALVWVVLLYHCHYIGLQVDAQLEFVTVKPNATEIVTDVNPSFNETAQVENSTAAITDVFPTGQRTATDLNATDVVTDNATVTPASITTSAVTDSSPTLSPAQPLPVAGVLPTPLTDVSSVCPCDVLPGQCDVNCCCDRDCGPETALFTKCSVETIVADKKMCNQDTARYTLTTAGDGLARVQSSISNEVNPDVFCIQTANYEAGLRFSNPEVPTDSTFDGLFGRFAGFFFGSLLDSNSPSGSSFQSSGYIYGDIIQTDSGTGLKGFFILPAPAATAHCTDANPAAFLKDQSTKCMRAFDLLQDCTTKPSLSMRSYTSFFIISNKTKDSNKVTVELLSITVQSLDGTRTRLQSTKSSLLSTVLLDPPPGTSSAVCNNVVLQVTYVVTYNDVGTVVKCTASFVLGAVDNNRLPIQQEFQIIFHQDTTVVIPLPFSGNPGYVVGLPLVAGSKTANGIIQSADRFGGMTLLRSSIAQQCLGEPAHRSPVLFGVNMVAGCTLRLEESSNCSVISEVILGVLRGQNFPEVVASFGNSQPLMVNDWVPISNQTTPAGMQGCRIPLSLDIEVRWTKYGSLVNPQAQIVNVTETIRTNTSSLSFLSGGTGLISISNSVTFVDVSASAQPGYKAPPTIDAKLPYDFFFPFV